MKDCGPTVTIGAKLLPKGEHPLAGPAVGAAEKLLSDFINLLSLR